MVIFRTFGWVQNPSNFDSLKKTVQVFDKDSNIHKLLINNLLPDLIHNKELLEEMIEELKKNKPTISYKLLVGTGTSKRSEALCDGIIQATIKAQKKGKNYIDNWSADGFVRWAHALGFIKYIQKTDSFEITYFGLEFSRTLDNSIEEKNILIDAMMTYPPAVRVLNLLYKGEKKGEPILTKFEIGKKLGFNENGFTSLPQDIVIETLILTTDLKEKNKIRADWEGSADKYARMISGWLEKLNLVSKVDKNFYIDIKGETFTERLGHAYKINGHGIAALRKARGSSKHSMTTKNVFWEMLATNVTNRNYVRSRRAHILKFMEQKKKDVNFITIQKHLASLGFNDDLKRIKLDIIGLRNMGLLIELEKDSCTFKDKIAEFNIPNINLTKELTNQELEIRKTTLRNSFEKLPPEHAELIEIAYDSKQNRLLEMKVMEIFKKYYGFNGKHLGGSRKPDGTIFSNDYGIIIDTKAYSKGYNLPISQADEMERYIKENSNRNPAINPNQWWDIFPKDINSFYYLFVSGHFTGGYLKQLERLSAQSGYDGGVIGIESFLRGADLVASKKINLDDFEKKLINNEIII